ncbi:MAG TPA: sialidase family protein [Gaiellaceae bacterium]|nr:sialidase family protein [Gaiellaceae bacterium]
MAASESEVTVGSPHHPFPQNKQNEPAVAIDASRPNIVAAGSNDEIDLAPCGTTIFASEESPCPFTPGVGVSGIYLSFDHGATWHQPTYTGWSARNGTPDVGPIGTIPWYYEAGLVSDGDPAVAFGPIPRNGSFSWANGSRLYYANLTSNFPADLYASGATAEDLDEEEAPERNAELREQGFAEAGPIKGFEGIAVSRADNIDASNFDQKSTWKPPVIASQQTAATQFADKEQIWADNAESSDFFGNVYVCYAKFVGGGAEPLFVSTSRDGGSTWEQKQVSRAAAASPVHFGQSGCTVRTNSHGVVYVFYQTFQAGLPGTSTHEMVRSYDGGRSWTRPSRVVTLTDSCFVVDPVIGRCVEDGIAGARNDLTGSPNVDIANGAPTGVGAPNTIVDNYITGPALNQERVFVQWATADEQTGRVPPGRGPALDWSGAQQVSTNGDRGFYTAPAFSPDGSDLYVVYNAFTTPFQSTTSTARGLVGVTRLAAFAGAPSGWTTLHRSPVGDPRSSAQNDLQAEFLGDYVYADAMNDYGVTVWNDARNGTVCPAINEWRQALRDDPENAGDPPNPLTDCPTGFGDSDIWSFTTH